MRLINVKTFRLEEFFGNSIPDYAILSHTWDAYEISFEDTKTDLHLTQKRDSFSKIQACIEQTLRYELDYCWVDTCCIDKSSSAELSEAINSMYRWYRKARICFVYMQDVHIDANTFHTRSEWPDFAASARWWTRG